MTTYTPPLRWFAAAAWVLCWCAAIVSAQTAPSGTIQGRVYNPSTGEYVRNAEIRLESTGDVTYSESDGTFQFNGVAPGEASITVTYSGYNTEKQTFTVTAGQTAVREINLTSSLATTDAKSGEVIKLQAFTVATEREGNAKAIMDQRRNMTISTSVASDAFGEVTDNNVGEFLKYLPGVDLDYVEAGARGPRLGGMDSQYVGINFDGVKMASADANRGGEASRATSFEGFSITAIESIEIQHTTSPESDADSPAGTINMKARRAFDRKGRRIVFNTSVNFNAEEFNLNKRYGPDDNKNYKWKPNFSVDYSESFLNNRLGVLVSASRANSYTEQYFMTYNYNRTPDPNRGDNRQMVITSLDFKDGPKLILKDALTATVDYKASPNLVLSLTAMYNYAEGEFWNRNFTFNAANNNANVNNGRYRVRGDGLLTVQTDPTSTVRNLTNGGGSSSKLTYTRTLAPKFEYKLSNWTFDGVASISKSVNNYEALERGFSSSEGGAVTSDWIATRPSLDSWEWTIRQTSGADWFNLGSFTNTNNRDGGTRVNNSGRTHTTELWSGALNARWVLPIRKFPTIIKFGGKWAEQMFDHINQDNWWIWSYVGPGGNTVTRNATTGVYTNTAFGSWANLGYVSPHEFDTGNTNAMTVYNINGQTGWIPRADRNRIAQLFRSNPEQFVQTVTPDNLYTSTFSSKRDVHETITAAYTQADVRLTTKLRVLAGVRYENTLGEFREFEPLVRADLLRAGYTVAANGRANTFEGMMYQFTTNPPRIREREYHNWFPSVNLKYTFTPKLQFQAGFNKAISRVPIDHMTGIYNIVDDANPPRIEAPNAELLPEHTKKYQARLAYYFGPSNELSVAFNQTHVKNLREEFDFTASEFGEEDPELQTYVFRSRRNSLEVRRFRNMSINYRQSFSFLPEKFRGLGMSLSYDRSYASQRRQNLSPHRGTTRLSYAYRRFNGSIGMVWSATTPTSNYGRFRKHQEQFDLQLSWKITRDGRFSTYVAGRNIFGKPVIEYDSPLIEGVDSALWRYQEFGANWVFGAKATF